MCKFEYLTPAQVEARVAMVKEGKGLTLLIYKDARCDMDMLDRTVGPERWQRKHEIINGNLYCSVGIKFGDEWVWKQDVGTESKTEAEKGQASDSFKRACFNWGIGRELYSAPFIWISEDKGSKYDRYEVTEMNVIDGQIKTLKIANASRGNAIVYSYGNAAKASTHAVKKQNQQMTEFMNLLARKGVGVSDILAAYNLNSLTDMTAAQYKNAMARLAKTADKEN